MCLSIFLEYFKGGIMAMRYICVCHRLGGGIVLSRTKKFFRRWILYMWEKFDTSPTPAFLIIRNDLNLIYAYELFCICGASQRIHRYSCVRAQNADAHGCCVRSMLKKIGQPRRLCNESIISVLLRLLPLYRCHHSMHFARPQQRMLQINFMQVEFYIFKPFYLLFTNNI